MKVSVLIPMLNEQSTIENLCQALTCQTYSGFDVFVLDDGSLDQSVEIASHYFQVHQGPGRGPDCLRNFGLQLTKADYVLFIDADCVPDLTWVEQMVSSLEDGYDGVAGKSVGVPFSNNTICKELVRKRAIARIAQTPWRTEYYFPTCNVAYKREILERLGGFPTSAHTSGDIVFSKLLGNLGYRCTINNEAVIYHYLAKSYTQLFKRYIRDGRGHPRLRWYNVPTMMIRIGLSPLHFMMLSLYHLSTLDLARDSLYEEAVVIPLVDTAEYALYSTGAILESLRPAHAKASPK